MGFADFKSLKWADWLYTLIAAGISAAATTVTANPLMSLAGTQQLTPRQLGVLSGLSAIVAMAGILKKSPLPDRALAIALLPGVHTEADVTKVLSAPAPGTVTSKEVATTILAEPGITIPPITRGEKKA